MRAQCFYFSSKQGAKLLRLGMRVDEVPVFCPVCTYPFAGGAEDISQVAANLALVGHAGQSAGAGQHAEQRHLGQADG